VHDVDGIGREPSPQTHSPPQIPLVASLETRDGEARSFEIVHQGVLPRQQIRSLVREIRLITGLHRVAEELLGAARS
jgi:hypothetical protein